MPKEIFIQISTSSSEIFLTYFKKNLSFLIQMTLKYYRIKGLLFTVQPPCYHDGTFGEKEFSTFQVQSQSEKPDCTHGDLPSHQEMSAFPAMTRKPASFDAELHCLPSLSIATSNRRDVRNERQGVTSEFQVNRLVWLGRDQPELKQNS